MSYSKACCTVPPVTSNYEPIGTIEILSSPALADLPVYVVGPKDAKKAVIVIYDVIGFHNNTKQFCDLLAKYGNYKVVMPDFFRGKTVPPSAFADIPVLLAWIRENGSMEKARPDINLVRESLEKHGVEQAGFVGFCWGAKIAIQVTEEGSFFAGSALIHPSSVDIKDAEAATAPVLAIPTKDEPDMTEYMNILSKKSFGAKCKHYRFDDMFHGFCAARGDFSDENNKKRATEAIQLTVKFFSEVFSI